MTISPSSRRTSPPWVASATAADPFSFCIEWNAENQLTRVTKNSVEQARFKYDPLGRRVEKVAGGVTTSWTYDNEDILRVANGSTTLKYVHGEGTDEPVAVDDGSVLAYFQADGLGSILKDTNAAGSVILTRQYDTWGDPQAGGTTSGYAFTGREWDPETGLTYYRARYYDPKVGRFVSEDPIGHLGGENFYRYVHDNPVNRLDPFGLRDWGPFGGKCCNYSGGTEWVLVNGKWYELPSGRCTFVQDCDGMTCGGGFYANRYFEPSSCRTPGCDDRYYRGRRWTPAMGKKGSPREQGSGEGDTPPGYQYGS